MKAVDKFGTEVISFYICNLVDSGKTRSIADQARTIRIPVHMIETINKIVRTQRQIMSEFGREPHLRNLQKLAMPLEKLERY